MDVEGGSPLRLAIALGLRSSVSSIQHSVGIGVRDIASVPLVLLYDDGDTSPQCSPPEMQHPAAYQPT